MENITISKILGLRIILATITMHLYLLKMFAKLKRTIYMFYKRHGLHFSKNI
jgi:hypothetical protein